MKTIVHVDINDEERKLLAGAWFQRSHLVTRNEVTQFVNAKIQLAILEGYDATRKQCTNANTISTSPGCRRMPGDDRPGVSEPIIPTEGTSVAPVSGNEEGPCGQADTPSYLTLPSAAGLTNACRRVIDHIAEGEEDGAFNIGWCVSILVAEGVNG